MHGVIYKITNTINGKYYIGSTVDFKKRKYTHTWKLNKGIHHSVYLQNAWNLYGASNFRFEILYESFDIKTDEQKELDALDWTNVYNISRTATRWRHCAITS